MKKKIYKIIVIIWFSFGFYICFGCFKLFVKSRNFDIHDKLFQTDLISLSYAFLIVGSSVGVIMKKHAANLFLIFSYAISLLYAFVYVFFGGIEDRGWVYSIIVAILTMISFIGIILASSKTIRKEYFQKGPGVK